jgi:hypothetical protein
MQLAKHNRVQLIWVLGHEVIASNETADQLAKLGSEYPFIGPEPACSISMGAATKAVKDWIEIIGNTQACQQNKGVAEIK